MLCRISLPVLRCSLWTDRRSYSYKTLSRFVFQHSRGSLLKMSSSKESVSQNVSTSGRNFPTVYVISKIENLSGTIDLLSNVILKEKLVVKNIDIPEYSEILKKSTIRQLVDAEIVVIDPNLLAFNSRSIPKLKWAHCTWAGVDRLFDTMVTLKPQFLITKHGNDEFGEQIAEYVMGHVLSFEKNLRGIGVAQIQKSWDKMKYMADSMPNRRLSKLIIGVLGVGNMGKAIAKFFKPHGTTVIGLSRRKRSPSEFGLFDRIESSIGPVIGFSDYIVNTLPSTPETVGLLNGSVLSKCTKKPVFINVGRGNIISEETLLNALKNQWLSHVVLDVFQSEPLPLNSKLWNCFNEVTITPHCAAISKAECVANDFLSSLLCYQQKSPMRNVVDWEKGY